MPGGTNGPPTLNGAQFGFRERTLADMRLELTRRLGFSAMAANPPPGLNELINSFLTSAHKFLYWRYDLLRKVRWWKIDVDNGSRHYDIPYSGAFTGKISDVTFAEGPPATIVRAAGSFVDDGFANGMTIRIQGSNSNDSTVTVATVAALTLTLSSGEELVAETAGAEVIISELAFINMEKRRIYEAWIKDDNTWSPMFQGINPIEFNQSTAGMPRRFDMREFIEIWPEPDKPYEVYILAHIGLTPFEYDNDVPSVDDHPVFLKALADAKGHYRQPDARTYYTEVEVLLRKLNAGTYGDKRFIPDGGRLPDRPMTYPQVTFSRT